MNPHEQHDEAAIFEEVLSASSPLDVDGILDRRCGTNTTLRARILSLLESYHGSEYLEEFKVDIFNDSLAGTIIGEFKVIELIGQGGMGDVYSARRLHRADEIVALKVIKFGMDTRQVIARFNLERSALSQFNHPNIAKYIGAGVDSTGRLYFAMELVQGISIIDYCDHYRMPIRDRLELFLDVCSAVNHAHEMGIVHRDLKPQNVLVMQKDGKAIVKVIDFGVAKALANENDVNSRLTGALQWIGTPKYISPEQLTWSSDVDVRADVYALGVMLFELLTGSTPSTFDETAEFDLSIIRNNILGESTDYCSERIASYRPTEASRHSENRSTDVQCLIRTLSGDIDYVIDKALQRNRDQRYAVVSQFADDVRAFLKGSSISLNRPSIVERWKRWQHRHPKISERTIGVTVAIAILVLVLSAIWEIQHANDLRASVSKDLAQASFVQNVQSASQSVFSGDTVSAKKSLAAYLEDMQSTYRNHFSVRYLQGLYSEPSQTLLGHDNNILDMDLAENDRWLASADRGGDIILWDRQTGREARRVHPSDKEVTRVRFRPHGKLLATTGQDALVRLWDAESFESTCTLRKHKRTVNGLAWSPDGRLLATGDRDGFVYIWDVDQQICVHELPKQLDTVRCIEWSPDGRYLAMAIKNGGVQLWETGSWSKISDFSNTENYGALAIAFSQDSQFMVYGGYQRTLSFVDMKLLSVEQEFGTQHNIYSIRFGRNSEVFVGEASGIVQLFQRSITLNSWVPMRLMELSSASGAQRAICLDEDADIVLIAAEEQKSIDAYPLSKLLGYQTKDLPATCIGTIAELGLRLLSAPGQNVVVQDDNDRIQSLNFQASMLCAPAYSNARKLIAIACTDGGVNLINAMTLETVGHLGDQTDVSSLQFSRTGQRLSICTFNGAVDVWDLTTSSHWHASELITENTPIGAFSPNEDLFVAGQMGEHTLVSFDEVNGQAIHSAKLLSVFVNLAFHPRGEYIVVGEMGWLSVWTSDLSKQLWRAPLTKNGLSGVVESLCFTPEGDCLAVLLGDGTVEFWAMQSKVRLFAVHVPTLSENSRISVRWMSFQDASNLWVSSEDGNKIFQFPAIKKRPPVDEDTPH